MRNAFHQLSYLIGERFSSSIQELSQILVTKVAHAIVSYASNGLQTL